MGDTILLIDDSREQLDIYKQYLEDKYHQVICFESGMEALEYLESNKPSLILLDIEMPFMNGFEVLERIRALDGCYNLPVIGLTGRNEKSVVLTFLSKGADGYLVKPVTKENLIENIEKFLRQERVKEDKKNILLVDDDFESLRTHQTMLKNDYNVIALNSSKLALDYLLKHKPDLILLDYYMVPFNGISVFNMVRKLEQVKDVPIGFITGCTDNEILLECTKLQPAGIILKPVEKEKLLEKIAEMLGK